MLIGGIILAEIIKAVKGTNDVLPENSYKWQYIENKMLNVCSLYGYREIRIPVFEHTEVFSRGVGDTTDVVQKEMYTFEDKGGRSITLRPEFTAGVMRSCIESGTVQGALPLKVCYIGGCYRYEKPQAGRLREFHQFGVECIGGTAPAADAEAICLANQVLDEIGIKNISLQINSIGCPECRKHYHAALKEFFSANRGELCGTCLERLDRNPMRILDCKSPVCSAVAAKAPVVLDYLCDDCAEHFESVKAHLSAAGISFTVNPHIVRGLDYYTKTVFEFVADDIGAQSTVCGGGRYDGLIAQLGGPQVQSVGFAMGIERLMLTAESQGVQFPEPQKCDVYFATMGKQASVMAAGLSAKLREEGFEALYDLNARSLKKQMLYADKIGAKFTAVLGDSEVESGNIRLKDMASGEQREIKADNIVEEIYKIATEIAVKELENSVLGE